jgi:hypothetical protein
VGEAVDLPEWLTPIAALEKLAEEFGLKLEYVSDLIVKTILFLSNRKIRTGL